MQIATPAYPERLTWDEIRLRLPDRWVVLVDIEWADEDGEIRTAVVLGEGKGRDETLRRYAPLKAGYREFSHRYTGRVSVPFPAINLVVP